MPQTEKTSTLAAAAPDTRILVAGAGGFIGGSLVRYFKDKGFANIRAVDKKPLSDWYRKTPGVECLCLDLSHEKNCRTIGSSASRSGR